RGPAHPGRGPRPGRATLGAPVRARAAVARLPGRLGRVRRPAAVARWRSTAGLAPRRRAAARLLGRRRAGRRRLVRPRRRAPVRRRGAAVIRTRRLVAAVACLAASAPLARAADVDLHAAKARVRAAVEAWAGPQDALAQALWERPELGYREHAGSA